MSSTQKNFALPLAFIGIMFFAIGFALGINSVLIPVLQGSFGITSAESYLIIVATFLTGRRNVQTESNGKHGE